MGYVQSVIFTPIIARKARSARRGNPFQPERRSVTVLRHCEGVSPWQSRKLEPALPAIRSGSPRRG